jgi:phage shock protein PspC (stress-responsive transcriptional regulator)
MKPFLKYGLIVGATGILLSLITYLLGLDKTDVGEYIGWINIPIMVVAMVFAIKERREKEFGGYMEFGKAFGTATMVVLIATAITAVYTYFYMSIINPSYREYALQKQITKMEEKGMPQDQIDTAMHYTEKFMTPTMMSVFVFFGGLVMGIIVALIVAAIMKKSNPNPFNDSPASIT